MPRKYSRNDAHHLAGHIPEPVVKNQVLAFLRTCDAPVTLAEVVIGTGLPRHTANRVLDRFRKQDVVAYWKLPMQRHRAIKGAIGQPPIPGGVTRQLYVHVLNEGF